jgi:hypothetical protein
MMPTTTSTTSPAFLHERERREAWIAASRLPNESYRHAEKRMTAALDRANATIEGARREDELADYCLLRALVKSVSAGRPLDFAQVKIHAVTS